tara:strand:+ start:324 stop:905 length:582 start_codon:yes stop_codon:yes gene_type:complete
MFIYKYIKFFLIIIGIFTLLNGCASLPKIPKPDFSKPAIEPNAIKRAQQNVIDGQGIKLFKKKRGNGNFLFASSNPMWKATLDTLSFISLANADYSGGVIITDWYSEEDSDEAIKITVRFLSNEIRADGMIINLYKRTCNKNFVCSTREIENDLAFEIKDKILKTAVIYRDQDEKLAFENRPKKQFPDKDSKN